MDKFYYINHNYIESDKQIGEHGKVFEDMWWGKPAAFKMKPIKRFVLPFYSDGDSWL